MIGYEFKMENLSKEHRELFEKKGGNVNSTIWYEYPEFTFSSKTYPAPEIFHPIKNKFDHIELFIVNLAATLKYKSLYSTDFLEYLELPKAPIFLEKKSDGDR